MKEEGDRTELSGFSETDVSQHAQTAAEQDVFKSEILCFL